MDLYTIKSLLSGGKTIYDLPLRVTFYARVSTDRTEQLTSLDNQVKYFNDLIKKQENWTYVDGYIDEGISGTSVKKRERFLEMIEDGKRKKFDLILTKEISRFSRNTLDSIKYTQELLASGIGVNFMSDNINTFMPDSELRLTIMASIAQEEIRKLSDRIKFGKRQSLEKGIVNGSDNFYGYVKDKGKLKIVEKEAKLVRLIYDLYIKDDIGTTRLGHKLYNEYGIKSATGKPLAGTVITRMIENPKYKGYYCGHKEASVDYILKQRKRFSKEEWVVYKAPDICPPIVSEEVWERANKILIARSNKHKCKDSKPAFRQYPFSAKLICYHDGATFVRGAYKNKKTDEKTVFWGCSNYRKYGKTKADGCRTPIIKSDELIQISKKIINDLTKNQKELFLELEQMINDTEKEVDNKKIVQDSIAKKIRENDELIEMRLRKEINIEEYTKHKTKIENEMRVLQSKLDSILSKENTKDSKEDSLKAFISKLENSVMTDDDSVLRIAESLFNKIYVERVEDNETSKRAILHIKLNVLDYRKCNLSLSEFLLLFNNSDRCVSCNG